MKMNKLPGGLWPVMLTPFLDNNKIDIEGLAELTDFYINTGARGLFANCLSSEMFQLTDEERLLAIQTVIEVSNGRVPVVASGTFGSKAWKSADFIKQVYDIGAAAVIIITNQIADINEDDGIFKKRTERLLKLTSCIPLGVYECPVPYKRLLTDDMMSWLGKTGRFFYHKDTSCDLDAIRNKLNAVKGTMLSLFNANTMTALSSLKYGASGISPIGANLYPELYAFLINGFWKDNDNEQLAELNAQLAIMDAIADQHYPFSAKLFLQRRGLPITTACRIPSGGLCPEDHLKIQALMNVFMQTVERFGVKIDKMYL